MYNQILKRSATFHEEVPSKGTPCENYCWGQIGTQCEVNPISFHCYQPNHIFTR